MGSPLFRWLAGLDADRLAEILVRRPDVAAPPPRDLPTLARRLQERGSVTLAFYGLPLPATQVVGLVRAIGGPTVPVDQLARALGRTPDDADLCTTLRLLAQHALVWPDPDDGALNMAAPLWPVRPYSRRLGPPPEPGDTPQNPQWRPRFDPQPPQPVLVTAAPGMVEREAAAAATSTVERAAALLAICAAKPVPVLKSGGVSARELRKLGKAIDCDELEVRLSLELAHAAGLVAVVRGKVLPTEAYDRWRTSEPASQLVTLLRAWRQLHAAPLTPGVTDAAPPAALRHDPAGVFAHHLRPRVLQVTADLPAGQGTTGAEHIENIMVWQSPMLVRPMPARSELIAGLWQEAGLLGAIAHGALTPLGRAVLHESGDQHSCHECASDLEQVARRLLPPAVQSDTFSPKARQPAEDPSMDAVALAVRLLTDQASDPGGTDRSEGPESLTDPDVLPNEDALPTALTAAEVDELVADVVRYASHLTTTELKRLVTALAFCTPVKIRYTNASGVASVRVIHPIDLAGKKLVAWCDLRDGERVFVLERIDAVAPV